MRSKNLLSPFPVAASPSLTQDAAAPAEIHSQLPTSPNLQPPACGLYLPPPPSCRTSSHCAYSEDNMLWVRFSLLAFNAD